MSRGVPVHAGRSSRVGTPQGAAVPVNRPVGRNVPAPSTSAAKFRDEALKSALAPVVQARAQAATREKNGKFQEHRLQIRLLRGQGQLAQQQDQRQPAVFP